MKIRLKTRKDESVSVDQKDSTLELDSPSGDELEIDFGGKRLRLDALYGRISLRVDGVEVWRE